MNSLTQVIYNLRDSISRSSDNFNYIKTCYRLTPPLQYYLPLVHLSFGNLGGNPLLIMYSFVRPRGIEIHYNQLRYCRKIDTTQHR